MTKCLEINFLLFLHLRQIFKNKYKDDFYPYLLPKSHSTAEKLPFTVPGSGRAKVQVLKALLWATLAQTALMNFYPA